MGTLSGPQATIYIGKAAKIVEKNLCLGNHREFGNLAQTQAKHGERCIPMF